MKGKKILWADDEIDMLKSHILFIEEKGYKITPVISGQDAIDCFKEETFDVVFVDENMPGITGLETLDALKKINPSVPVIMITKSEDEGIMTHAIGKQIADYLIKPVNPNQILLALKKILHKEDIVSEAVLTGYRNEFAQISAQINDSADHKDWQSIYKNLIDWELNLAESKSPLLESLLVQKQEANTLFSRYIKVNYEKWMLENKDTPLLSHQIFQQKVFPYLDNGEKVFFVLIDNFRLDQWFAIKDLLTPNFNITEDSYYSILPTATQYARNALFAGLTPAEIKKNYPKYWKEENEEGSKNEYEAELVQKQLERANKNISFSYHKVMNSQAGEKLLHEISNLKNNDLNILVINFVDMLSHARTDSKMIRELASDESAYRSVTKSWFRHSSTLELIQQIGKTGAKIILTSDHGTIRVKKPLKVLGEKDMNTNLRYKLGRNIQYDRKKVYDVLKPENVGLPSPSLSARYIFACNDDFFAYPNDFQSYASFYTDTFQHGGISLEEMIVPLISITAK